MNLFTPLQLKSLTSKNRIMVSPMCQYSSEDGFVNDWHLVHLGTRAVGGAGIVFTEAAAITKQGRISKKDLGIWKDDHIDGLQRITKFISEQGAIPGIQLAHSGRKGSRTTPWEGNLALAPEEDAWETLAPSPLPFAPKDPVPIEMNKAAIQAFLQSYQSATQRALEAGFKILEIHAGNGYLLHQFYSGLANQRKDQYGGSFENRIRLLIEVVRTVKQVWPENYPLFVRVAGRDWVDDPNAWSLEQTIELCQRLEKEGVDLIDPVSGFVVPKEDIPFAPGFQVPFSTSIKEQTAMMVGAVGGITDPNQANKIVQDNQADLIIIARELLRNPYFPIQAAIALEEDSKIPNQYLRGF